MSKEIQMNRWTCVVLTSLVSIPTGVKAQDGRDLVLKPARVFDGIDPKAHDGWVVVIRGQRIESAGPAPEVKIPPEARVIDLPEATLLPGLIEAHSHLLLHPYNETSWED